MGFLSFSMRIRTGFHSQVYTRGVDYGPLYSTGDVVGCGLNVLEKTVFFTKNGVNLGELWIPRENAKKMRKRLS